MWGRLQPARDFSPAGRDSYESRGKRAKAPPQVESRTGAGTDAERRPVSRPRSSNRTCPFRASGFPTGFIADSRTRGSWPLES